MSENINLADKSQLALWQSYCDKKMECENLTEEIERLRSERDELVNALELSLDAACQPYACGEDFCEQIMELLTKIKGEDK